LTDQRRRLRGPFAQLLSGLRPPIAALRDLAPVLAKWKLATGRNGPPVRSAPFYAWRAAPGVHPGPHLRLALGALQAWELDLVSGHAAYLRLTVANGWGASRSCPRSWVTAARHDRGSWLRCGYAGGEGVSRHDRNRLKSRFGPVAQVDRATVS
jgi:hypothetical protein